jgi:Tol biopolymer transport system component
LSWSPDGTLLAYQNETGESKDRGIGLLNVATLETRLLGHPAEHCAWSMVPTFAPDGRSLAVACAVTSDVTDLCIMPVSGGTGPCVARVEGEFTGMTWAADGKSIVFASNGNLWRVAVAGGVVQKLLAGRDAAAPTISRDGRRLAFEQSVVNVNLWQVRLAATTRPDGTPLKLISSSRMQRSAAFSPDGRRVAFESNRSGTTEIWVSDADGSNASALTAFGGPLTGSPDWSPDGRYIAFDSKAGGHSGLYVAGAEGGPVRRIQTGRVDSSVPIWSADGRWFYFASPVAGRDEIFRVPVQGGTASAVTHAGGFWPRMSRDGARIYYFNAGAIWWVPTAGGRETRLAGMPRLDPEFSPSWAVARLGVYFINPKAPAGIDFLDFASERVVRVLDLPGKPEEYSNLSLSPDGRRLLYAQRDGFVADIMLIDRFQ